MAKLAYVVVGRADDCAVVIHAASVSSRHARLSWQRGELIIEDLGSANGTYVDGEKLRRPTAVRVGADVRLGVEMLPWDDEKLRAFLRHGASDTIVAQARFGRYRCPKCKKVAIVPLGLKQGELSCTECGTALFIGQRPPSGARGLLLAVVLGVATLAACAVLLGLAPGRLRPGQSASDEGKALLEPLMPESFAIGKSRTANDMSAEEQSIRDSGTARRVMEAMDAESATTRNLAVQIASKAAGPYHVEQVAAIWLHVRASFNYVNDPRGSDYFARASETIANGFAGDCDDFATTLAAMVTAVGGRARVIIMDGARGGHAYAEACIDAVPTEIARRLRRYVQKHWDKRLGSSPSLSNMFYRTDESCPVWLNLDWNANVPAGPYEDERWAVAIERDGATETLTPADAPKARARTR